MTTNFERERIYRIQDCSITSLRLGLSWLSESYPDLVNVPVQPFYILELLCHWRALKRVLMKTAVAIL